ncbi:hypothetical protein L208DRAFT_1161617, partial [Tricholoma matsutake]
TKPFLQCIQLRGINGDVVCMLAQVDDGASKNCITKKHWEAYHQCLGELAKSRTTITFANNAHVKSMGIWTGMVQVGGTTARCTFEVFDCNDTFDIILGKPWLRTVKAIHYYEQDRIVIGQEGNMDILLNK